jgi:hypothetical protein
MGETEWRNAKKRSGLAWRMAWVKGRYQHSVRINGRVTTRYYGGGDDGQLFAAMDLLIRHERNEARQQARELDEEQRRLHQAERDRSETVRQLVALNLEAAGFHRQGRHRWRRKRRMSTALSVSSAADAPTRARLLVLLKEVREKVPGALKELRAIALSHPELVVTETFGDLVKLAMGSAVLSTFKDDDALQECLQAQIRFKLAELAGENPSPIRKVVVETAVFDWVVFWHVSTLIEANHSLQMSRAWLRRQNDAHRRLMRSLRELAQIEAAERPRRPLPSPPSEDSNGQCHPRLNGVLLNR